MTPDKPGLQDAWALDWLRNGQETAQPIPKASVVWLSSVCVTRPDCWLVHVPLSLK